MSDTRIDPTAPQMEPPAFTGQALGATGAAGRRFRVNSGVGHLLSLWSSLHRLGQGLCCLEVTGWGRICNCQSSRLESIEDEPDGHRASPIAVATRSIEWLLTSRRG